MKLQEQLLQRVDMNPPSPKGWRRILCKVCNDHGHKGKRAAFKFDGDTTAYNCFNCGASGSFNDDGTFPLSDEMIKILVAFGFDNNIIDSINFAAYARRQQASGKTVKKKQPNAENINPDVLPMPIFFKYMASFDSEDPVRKLAERYLERRGFNPNDYPYMLVDQSYDERFTAPWVNRLIIPVYNSKNELIFWQGRDIVGNMQEKYLSPGKEKRKVLFGFERLNELTDAPLYISEGIFDAMLLKGCAVLGKKLYPPQIAHLKRSRRPKIFVPDRSGGGHVAAQQAIDLGWGVSFPDIGAAVDINDAVQRYGILYVKRTIGENVCFGSEASTRLPMYCSDYYDKK